MMRVAGFMLTVALLGGCTASPIMTSDNVAAYEAKFPYGKIQMQDGEAFASYIQWNEEYAVTARHVGSLNSTAFICDANCDLQFVKHKAVGPYAAWRDGQADETITHMGLNARGKTVVSTGKNLNEPVSFGGANDFPYRTSSAGVIPGMSGGPVYGEDGKVIGMSIASYMTSSGRDAIYVPYSTVLKQWQHFKP